MDAMEIQPQDAYCAREATEQAETRALDDATFKSADYLEQTGDFKQAELIQTSLEAVMYSITTEGTTAMQLDPEAVSNIPLPLPTPEQGGESPQAVLPEDSVAGRFPSMQEGPFEPPGGGDDEGDNITPINLPGPQSTAGEEIGFKFMPKEPGGSAEIPLPGIVEEAGDFPAPMPSPEKEPAYQVAYEETSGSLTGNRPGIRGDLDQVTAAGSDSPGGDEATPITLPGPRGIASQSANEAPAGESPQAVLPEDSVAGRQAGMQEGPLEPPGGGEDDKDDITPINLPGPQSTEINFTSMTKEPAGSTEIPLPGTAVETGWKIDEGELQIPLASPAQEGVRDELLTIDQMVTRAETAMDDMSQSFNQQYLDLQKQMQDENRQFTMVSNIMKTKHDTAEKSINNIR